MHTFKYHLVTLAAALALGAAVAPPACAQKFSDWAAPTHLDSPVNTPSVDGCPFISKDGLSLFFASDRTGAGGGTDIYVTQRESTDAPWGQPENLGVAINGPTNDFCPMLTIDAHYLYFVSTSRADGCGGMDIYASFRRDKRDNFGWEPAVNLGCQVNSPQNDFTPSIFDDEEGRPTLYFGSNRPGGPGGTDIYASVMQTDGSFGAASLVAGLNTPSNDQRPNVRRDGREIFFDSNRPGSAGFDLWTATRASTSDGWAAPTNLGPSVNSAGSEGRPSLSFDGLTLYFMSNRPGSLGDVDIFFTTRTKLRKAK